MKVKDTETPGISWPQMSKLKQGCGGKSTTYQDTRRAKETIFAMNSITLTLYSIGQIWISFSHAYGESIEIFKEAG